MQNEKTNDDKIVKKLLVKADSNINDVLHETFNTIVIKLKNGLSNNYEVTSDELVIPKRDWFHQIKVKKNRKIGVILNLSWRNSMPSNLEIGVTKDSELSSMITYVVSLIFLATGAYMGINKIEPLDFLSGYILAAVLGALMALVPGVIVISILKTIILRKEKVVSEQLLLKIKDLVRSLW